jgi:hypothetical protein
MHWIGSIIFALRLRTLGFVRMGLRCHVNTRSSIILH